MRSPNTSNGQNIPKPPLPKTNSMDSANFRMGEKKPGFMGKIFGRQNSLEKDLASANDDESRPFDPITALNLQPCPFIRPTATGMRMVAREETPLLLTRSQASPSLHGPAMISRCRARAEAAANDSTITYEDWEAYQDQSTSIDSQQMVGDEDGQYSIIFDIAKQHDFVVFSSAPIGNAAAVMEWTNYIKFYSQVRSSLSLSCCIPNLRAKHD